MTLTRTQRLVGLREDLRPKPEVLPTCYIAGPMRGIPEFNYLAFKAATRELSGHGFRVHSPHEKDLERGIEPDPEGYTKTPLKEFMQYDLPLVCQSDVVFTLNGWEKSKGARLEMRTAQDLGTPVYSLASLKPIGRGFPVLDVHTEPIPNGPGGKWPISETSAHPQGQRVYQIMTELAALHAKKQADYGLDHDPFANVRGSEDWAVPAWVGAMVRANDKVKRLQTLARKGSLSNESAIDSFNDLAVYAIIARVLFEEKADRLEEAA